MAASYKEFKKGFKRWLALKTEHCKEVAPLFSYAYDRKLTLWERFRVKLHLFTCGACTNYVSNLRFMHEVIATQDKILEKEEINISLAAESKERIKNALKAARH